MQKIFIWLLFVITLYSSFTVGLQTASQSTNQEHLSNEDNESNVKSSSRVLKIDLSKQNSNIYQSPYLATLKAGIEGQTFQVEFKMSLSQSWILGAGCLSYDIEGAVHQKFNPNKTLRCQNNDQCTPISTTPSQFNVTQIKESIYETQIIGNEVNTQIVFGDEQLDTAVVLARQIYSDDSINIQGQIGLGNPLSKSRFLTVLADKGQIFDQVFSYYFPGSKGQLIIGGYDPDNYASDIKYFKATFQIKQEWTLTAKQFRFGSFKAENIQFQISTTFTTYLSDDIYQPFMSYHKWLNCNAQSSLPPFIFTFTDVSGIEQNFELQYESFLIMKSDPCELSFMNIGGDQKNLIIVGYDFMKQYAPIFSYNSTIGLGLAKQLNDSSSSSLSTLAIIFISVGCVIGFLVALYILYILYRKYTQKKMKESDLNQNLNNVYIVSEYSINNSQTNQQQIERQSLKEITTKAIDVEKKSSFSEILPSKYCQEDIHNNEEENENDKEITIKESNKKQMRKSSIDINEYKQVGEKEQQPKDKIDEKENKIYKYCEWLCLVLYCLFELCFFKNQNRATQEYNKQQNPSSAGQADEQDQQDKQGANKQNEEGQEGDYNSNNLRCLCFYLFRCFGFIKTKFFDKKDNDKEGQTDKSNNQQKNKKNNNNKINVDDNEQQDVEQQNDGADVVYHVKKNCQHKFITQKQLEKDLKKLEERLDEKYQQKQNESII